MLRTISYPLISIVLCMQATLASETSLPNAPVLGKPDYIGSGCPKDSIAFFTFPGDAELHMGFYGGAFASTGLERKTCKVTIPLEVPSGMQVSVLSADAMGLILSGKGEVTKRLSLGREPSTTVSTHDVIEGVTFGWFPQTLSENKAEPLVISKCGSSTNFQFDTAIRGLSEDSKLELSAMRFRLAYQTCQ